MLGEIASLLAGRRAVPVLNFMTDRPAIAP